MQDLLDVLNTISSNNQNIHIIFVLANYYLTYILSLTYNSFIVTKIHNNFLLKKNKTI